MTTARVLVGDCLESMRTLPDGVARCCVTSPPYFGLRDYGVDGQIGLEPTPEAYIDRLVAVFREVRRVLADDGTLWLNLGDSYAAGGGAQVIQTKNASHGLAGMRMPTPWIAPKNLLGIPWRVALALQADGWYLRSDIIWHKPNPMPESVKDRPTKAHEYLFLLAKSGRYYYDAEAIAEEAVHGGRLVKATNAATAKNGQKGRYGATAFGFTQHDTVVGATRNARTVWTIPTRPFKGAHFAVFPEALAERCILAGSAPGDTILDPFGGSGTVGVVATKRGRSAILCELNPEYAAMAEGRVAQTQPGLGLEVARA